MLPTLTVRQSLIGDLREVLFTFELDGELVPGLMYLPAETEAPIPLVFIQHPGMGSKEDYFVAEVGKLWALRGWACAGLDAPRHGERRNYDPMSLFRDKSQYPAITAAFARELHTAIDLLAVDFPVDVTRMGFAGYSLGSMLGIRAVAQDGRFKAAAFCLVGEGGLVGEVGGDAGFAGRMKDVAVRVVGKASDELIPRAATEALYAALPGRKEIVWLPGGHYEIGPDVIKAAGDWLAQELR
ncbi:MAG: hypothetical protein ABIP13_07420 [Tepidiformaceae bacterium]